MMQHEADENEVVIDDQEPAEEPIDIEDRLYEQWLERKLFGEQDGA